VYNIVILNKGVPKLELPFFSVNKIEEVALYEKIGDYHQTRKA